MNYYKDIEFIKFIDGLRKFYIEESSYLIQIAENKDHRNGSNGNIGKQRLERVGRCLKLRKMHLKRYSYDKFQILFDQFDSILREYDEDIVLIV